MRTPFNYTEMPIIQRETGLNIPNVMTPGAWALVSAVLGIVLIGFIYLFVRWWQAQVKWQPLGFMGVKYFAEDAMFDKQRLVDAIDKARAFLILNSHWSTAQTDKALTGFKVYVFADDVNAGKVGIFGYEKDGVIGVNRKLTTLCHEMGHMLQEAVGGYVDYYHVKFDTDGITAADKAYGDWLAKQ